MSLGSNPYILFLILILLVLGTDPEATRKMDVAKNVMDRMMSAMNNFRTGMQSMSAEFDEIHVMLRDVSMFGTKDK